MYMYELGMQLTRAPQIGFLIKSLKFADPPTCTYLSIKTGYQLPHLFELKSTHTN